MTQVDLTSLRRAPLETLATAKDIDGAGTMTKDQLVAALAGQVSEEELTGVVPTERPHPADTNAGAGITSDLAVEEDAAPKKRKHR